MWSGRTRHIARPPIAQVNRHAARLAAEGRDLINLGQAVLGLPPPRPAVDAVQAYLEGERPHVYSPDPGLPEALVRVVRFLESHKGIANADPDRVLLTCGASQAFANALFTVTNPGDEVVVFGPYYFDHVFAIQLAGCVPVEVPLVRQGRGYAMDPDRLADAITPRTRCVVLVSPGNPTGFLADRATVEHLCRVCDRHGLWLLSDETYDLLTYPPHTHVSPASLGLLERVCVIGSFSKTLAMAAWRIGYLYGPPDLVEESIKVQDSLVVCAPVPAQHALMAALSDIEGYTRRARAELVRRREALWQGLEACPLLEPHEPDGGTFVFAAIRSEQDSLGFCTRLLDETGLVSVPGAAFGPLGEGHVRFSFGNQPVPRLEEAARRLALFA